MKPFTRILLLLSGWITVILATLGVVLPVLPTTPFLLLAAWFFSRSSPRFHHWLLCRSWFGGYIRHWQTHKGLPRKAKRRAVIVILLTFAVSLWLVKLIYICLLYTSPSPRTGRNLVCRLLLEKKKKVNTD